MMGMQGKSNRAINRATGLSNGQIAYRMKKLDGTTSLRMDYRNNDGALAKQLSKATEPILEEQLLAYLHAHATA